MKKTTTVLMAAFGAALLCGISACTPSKPADQGTTAPAPATTPAPATATPSYKELVAGATQIFQQQYPGSILFTAIAKPSSGVAKTASDLTDWVFDADLANDGGIAELTYSNGAFGTPSIIGSGWIGLLFNQLPQGSLTLDEGIKVLNDKGYTQGFSNVSFGTPVVQDPQPMFWFCVDGETQGVSASTGDFFPDLFPCSDGKVGSLKP